MACSEKGSCVFSFRKGGNAVHCQIQAQNGGKWDFCAHQYFCRNTNRYELSKQANMCTAPEKLKDGAAADMKAGNNDKGKEQ